MQIDSNKVVENILLVSGICMLIVSNADKIIKACIKAYKNCRKELLKK